MCEWQKETVSGRAPQWEDVRGVAEVSEEDSLRVSLGSYCWGAGTWCGACKFQGAGVEEQNSAFLERPSAPWLWDSSVRGAGAALQPVCSLHPSPSWPHTSGQRLWLRPPICCFLAALGRNIPPGCVRASGCCSPSMARAVRALMS